MSTLNEDVNVLGRVLGTVLREQEGVPFFELVEEVRTRTKALRAASADARGADTTALQTRLASVSPGDAEGLVRAFSMYFQLVNMAEENERVRRVAERPGPRKEGLEEAFRALAARGLDADAARALVERVELGLTFTAHPTEMRRRTLREHLAAIAAEIPRLSDPDALERVTAHVEALWGTLELRRVQPTVRDEVQGGLAYVPVIASVLPQLARELSRAFHAVYGAPASLPLPLALCSWMGGDRDGNPNVTPEVTRETFELHTERARAMLRECIDDAFTSLSQHASRVHSVPAELGDDEEPWRAALRALYDALDDDAATSPIEPVRALTEIEETLRAAGQRRSADAFAMPLRVRARVFGTHLVSLDVREHSHKTGAAVAQLLERGGRPGYASLDEHGKRAVIVEELKTKRPLLGVGEVPPPELELVLGPLRATRDAIDRAGLRAFGRYITSMSEDVSDLLEVLILAREVGVRVLPVPLFETKADLERAPAVLRDVLAIPAYRAHLGTDVQEVMIGYSDSNKDAGFFAAYWSLYDAQRRIAEVCEAAGVRFRFFHGRGTSIGRGGGPMVRGILGQPAGTIGAGLRITEQGEALADKYSHPERARRNLEQGLYALLVAAAAPREVLPTEWTDAMARATDASARTYRELVEHPRFLAFFEAVTPINEIAHLRIASRPVRRPGPPTLANLRAIPWVMSWTQNRANVPGWYGVHVALREIGVERAREMYRTWPFFRTMLDNAQMSLAMSDDAIFRAYLALAPGEDELARRVLEAREETIARVCEVIEGPLLKDEPRIARSIELRNPYVEPIHRLQVELLRRVRAGGEGELDPQLERALLLSVHGIAAGVRNAG
ncbi:phosphoenolpyruvate carboxylase [Sandaracinus amylolyticus]|uniref:Phosphoenolpyruvate carboxylase n=1 Tax=Sandaracinus amylolyticus TaxID=927083 RepID=A0A0F6W2Q6_9BACT|nr:phosphoenolpyruvate carboxylase [Sandaracinus amylolyticus]AKF05923.1 Phosphoenolpyruvate carboxylase [Sandaracinus amylolyticus]